LRKSIPRASSALSWHKRPPPALISQHAPWRKKTTETWGQQVIVENRAGANGGIGGDLVAKSRHGRYTMLLGVGSAIVINPFVYKTLPFDPLRDLAPVTKFLPTPSG
jgi:tripartite-type tricarboxylate transporter receptor subunit TctC